MFAEIRGDFRSPLVTFPLGGARLFLPLPSIFEGSWPSKLPADSLGSASHLTVTEPRLLPVTEPRLLLLGTTHI